jgi:hypothetical protein
LAWNAQVKVGLHLVRRNMAELKFTQRKTVNIHWDTDEIKGGTVSIEASADHADMKEVRSGLENDGYATITFPSSFSGSCYVTVNGSKSGEQSGTVEVQ